MNIKRWHIRFFATISLAIVLTMFNLFKEEPFAMANPITQMGWEWRAERTLEQRAGLRLIQIKKEGDGLFGIGRSPALGGSLPEAQSVQAEVLVVDQPGRAKIGTIIRFRIPKVELKGATEGAFVVIGIIGQNAVCFVPAPTEVTESSLANWLPKASCP